MIQYRLRSTHNSPWPVNARQGSTASPSFPKAPAGRGGDALELVVEGARPQALPLLGGNLDVGRREQVHAVGDGLDLPTETEDEPGREVHQASRRRVFRGLEVHDHRDPGPELVPQIAGVV